MADDAMAEWRSPLEDLDHLGRPVDTAGYRCAEVGRLHEGLWVVAWVAQDGDSVSDAAFEVYGSPAALALANWFAMAVIGRARSDACQVGGRDALEALALPADTGGEALRIEDALQQALACDDNGGSNEH